MDPIRNPYAPGAGQRPPELAGRDAELAAVDVALERAARGRPERSVVLVGLRGVGKTVLLNALRSRAMDRLWGTAKLEVRPGHSIRRPVASALHLAVRDIGTRHRDPARVEEFLGVLKAFALRSNPDDAKLRDRWQPGIDVAAAHGRADTGDIEIDLLEVLVDAAELARDVGTGVGLFVDEMQDLGLDDASALCAAFHEISQQGLPFVLVGAGLPHVPATLSASKSYSERLFRYVRVDRLDQVAAERAWVSPAREEGVEFTPDALAALYAATDGYPYFVQAYGKSVWDVAPASPISADDVAVGAPLARADLGVGFFGSRYERATPAEREYLRAMADLASALPTGDGAVATSEVAAQLGRKPSSLSPARDALLKKGLVYSAERGSIAFTVPHFAAYLRDQPAAT
ncbi:MAG: ATP-binding protein [Jiangellales bacterium]